MKLALAETTVERGDDGVCTVVSTLQCCFGTYRLGAGGGRNRDQLSKSQVAAAGSSGIGQAGSGRKSG